MKTLIYIIILTLCASCSDENKLKIENPNYLIISDSISIPVDSLTNTYSSCTQFKDSLLLILNSPNNTISILNLKGKLIKFFDFNLLLKQKLPFEITSTWFKNLDSIYLFLEETSIIYLFSKDKILDSFPSNYESDRSTYNPFPTISTRQIPINIDKSVYIAGYSIGENDSDIYIKRNIISQYENKNRFMYGEYPKNYRNIDWGGIYFNEIYMSNLVDSLIYILFPGSNEIGVFNTTSKTYGFKELEPDISKLTLPYYKVFKKEKIKRKNKFTIAKHYYGQHSFASIIYDNHKNVYYRFLLKPTDKKNIDKMSMGPQAKYLITYDKNFKLIGYNEIDETYSHFTYFITPKGLYLQKIIKQQNEDKIYFHCFSSN